MSERERALIVGAGEGLSLSLARRFKRDGMEVGIAARSVDKVSRLAAAEDVRGYDCDASRPDEVDRLFANLVHDLGAPDIVVYNPSARVRGPVTDLDRERVKDAIMVTCYGGFLVAQAAARLMLERGHGSLFFTGASASVKGYPNSSSFAMGKFGLRGLSQSLARELQPQNIHVAHFVIDGGIASGAPASGGEPDRLLDPDAIAQTYLTIHRQHRSAWTSEVELRPWVEKF